jgi:hypothetical protein
MDEVTMKDLDKHFAAIHGDKYSYTVGKYGLYYKWNTDKEKEFKPGFNWNGVFKMKDSISFKSTIRATGEKEKRDFGDRIIEIPITEPTGYLRQEFNFINKLFYNYSRNTDEYKNLLQVFSLVEMENIKPEVIPLISGYRDALMIQINRQVKAVGKLNSEIIEVLKVFYFEGEKETLKGNTSDYTTEELTLRGHYFTEKNHQIKLFVEVLIAPGAKSDLIENHGLTNKMLNHSYLGDDITQPTLNGIITLTKQRDPLLIVSAKLASTVTALDSILEDIFLNDRVKSNEQYENDLRFNSLPDPKETAILFVYRDQNRAKFKTPEMIEPVYEIVREYIYKNNLTKIEGRVRTITNTILENLGEVGNAKTIDRWIKFYWSQYRPE